MAKAVKNPVVYLSSPTKALALGREGVFGLVLLLTLVLGWVMALGAGGSVMLKNLYDGWALDRMEQVVVYLPAETPAAEVERLAGELQVLQGVNKAEVVPQATVAERLAAFADDLNGLPLPVVVELSVAAGMDRAALRTLVTERSPMAEVDEGSGMVEVVGKSVKTMILLGAMLAMAMAVLMLLLVAMLVKLSLRSQRAVLSLLVDLGATDDLVARLVVTQVLGRVVWGWLGASALAAAMLFVTILKYPALQPVVTPAVWVALLAVPASLVLVAGLVGALSARRMVREAV